MKYSYRLKRSCGNIYSNGNVIFTPDGNIALAPVGNRINVFDLIHQTTECLPIETKKDIHLLTLSHNSKYLVVIDVDGFGLFFHFQKKILLHQFNFRQKVYAIQFSWNDSYFAVTHGRGCQIWKTPSAVREFIPLKLLKTITGHYDETVSLDWSSNSKHLIIGSKDLTSRVYFNVPTNYMTLSVLVGHRDEVVGVFFSADDKQAYTIAGDGGVFVWQYARITLPAKLKANDSRMNVKPLSSSLRKRKNKRKSEEDDEGGKEEEDEEGTEEEDDSDEFDENDKEDSNHEQKEDPASFIDPENEGDEGLEANTISKVKTSRKGSYQLLHRHLLRDNQQGDITSSSFHKKSNLLVLGFSAGIVAIYEMPDCTNIHRLSISNHPVSTISINLSGEWLGMGIGALGQLLIWEWKSESYILKQQGHSYGLNVLDFSAEGQFVATGGDDGKVKIWNTFTGFCAVTFKEHLGPVTGVKFIGQGQGKAILSSSLDGTVRAHDLLRYKNFRTLTSPQAVQFTSLTADQSGEIVCAGSQDPFEIYVWALQTGKLLEVLSGHEGPIACLAYSSSTSMLASGSWDGTLKLWDIYNNSCIETFEHGCDVLAVAFRSDGKEVACTATDGNIYFWDTDSGEQKKNIEGRRDLAGGRVTTDRKTKENLTKSKYFTSISYSADGTSVLVGGKSKYICIYCIQTGVLVKKFQLSHNRSLEGIADRLRSDHLIDGVSIDNLKVDLTSPNAQAKSLVPTTAGPGTAKHHKTNLSTNTKLQHAEIMTYALQFSVTGKEFAVVSSEGLQIYSLDHLLTFIPMELDVTITPENALRFFLAGNYLSSLQMSIILQDEIALRKIVETIPRDNIEIHIKQFDPKYLKQFIPFLTDQLESSRKLECYLYWIFMILQIHTMTMQRMMMNELSMIECFRNLLRVLLLHEKDLLQLMNKNSYLLQFIISQLQCPDEADQRNSPLPELMNGAGLDDEWKNNEDEVAEVAEVALDEEAMDEDLGEVVDGNVEFSPMEEEDNGVPWQSAWDDDDDDDNVISLNAGHDNIVEIDLESTKISKKKAAKSEKKKKSKTK